MSELQKSIENFFQNELSVFKEKCEELVSKSYANVDDSHWKIGKRNKKQRSDN